MERPSLDAPPDLRVGDWWRVEVTPALAGETYSTTLVVTDREGGMAGLGIPPDAFSHDFLVLHVPPLGDLDLETFGWRVMWDDFAALRFPLEPGRTWTADFHGMDVEARVVEVDGSRAEVVMEGSGERIELTYDAQAGMITRFREEALGLAFEVTDHGTGFEGDVLALSGIELGFMQSPGGAESVGDDGVRRADTAAEVVTAGNHGSLSLVLWNVGREDEPGRYRITATAPDGATFREDFQVEPGAPSILVRSFGHDAPGGAWTLDFEREGPAGLLAELFTYRLRRVTLGAGG